MKIETVSYQINWRNFKKGYSFFVPCIDTEAARYEVERTTRRLKMQVLTRVEVKDGIKGLRVWRV